MEQMRQVVGWVLIVGGIVAGLVAAAIITDRWTQLKQIVPLLGKHPWISLVLAITIIAVGTTQTTVLPSLLFSTKYVIFPSFKFCKSQ